MLRAILAACVLSLAAAPSRAEDGGGLTAEQFFAVCAAETVEVAGALGDALGWRRMAAEERSSWTKAIEADQGVRAASVGWRRDAAEGADALAFWTVEGSGQRYRACAFSTRAASNLSEALRRRYGPPGSTFDAEPLHNASWQAGRSEVTEARARAAGSFEIVTDE